MANARVALKTLACDDKSVEMELKMKVNKKLCICLVMMKHLNPFLGWKKFSRTTTRVRSVVNDLREMEGWRTFPNYIIKRAVEMELKLSPEAVT